MGEERQRVNHMISWISKYKSIYFEQEYLLKIVHMSKRMKELIRQAWIFKKFKINLRQKSFVNFNYPSPAILIGLSLLCHFSSLYHSQNKEKFFQLKKKFSLYLTSRISFCSIFWLPFAQSSLKTVVYSLFPIAFFAFFCISVPIKSLPHNSTETSPVTIITDFILVNTKANSQPLLSLMSQQIILSSLIPFFFFFFTCITGNHTIFIFLLLHQWLCLSVLSGPLSSF